VNILKEVYNIKNLLKKCMDPKSIERFLNLDLQQQLTTASSIETMIGINTAFMFWKRCGSRIFILSDNLIEAFQNTNVPQKLKPKDFEYPFDSFIIEGYSKPLFTTMIGEYELPVYAILYSYSRKFSEEKIVPSHMSLMSNIENLIYKKKLINPNTVDIGYDRSIFAFYKHPLSDTMDRIQFDLVDNKSFEEISKFKRENLMDIMCDEDDIKNVINMFCNSILYINEPNRIISETEERKSRTVIIGGKNGTQRQEYILLKPPKSYKSKSEYAGGELTVRFPVMGHWRDQACGEKYSLRKHIWIKPFWKGPELAEVVSKPYLVT